MRHIAFLLATCMVLSSAASLAEGWSFKNLWPQSSGNSGSSGKKTSLLNGKPLIGSPYKGRSAEGRGGPSVFSRFGDGTKTFFSKTTDVLTLSFLRDKPKEQTISRFPSWKQDSSNTGSRWSNKKDKSEKEPGWFSSMFQPSEPSHPSRTMSDFFAQDRPQ